MWRLKFEEDCEGNLRAATRYLLKTVGKLVSCISVDSGY